MIENRGIRLTDNMQDGVIAMIYEPEVWPTNGSSSRSIVLVQRAPEVQRKSLAPKAYRKETTGTLQKPGRERFAIGR